MDTGRFKAMMARTMVVSLMAATIVCLTGCATMAVSGGRTDWSGAARSGMTSSSKICGKNVPYSAAHRGCHIDGLIQENTPAAVAMAARYGYRAIECDVKYTADSVMVIMHDGTINRTMRNADDYSPIVGKVKVSETKFADLRSKYVIASSDESLRTPIPTLEEHIAACKEYGIMPILHSALPESYAYTKSVLGDNFVAFDVSYEALKKAREISSCLILWDPGERTADETIAMLKEIGGRCGVSSMSSKLLDAEYIAKVRAAGFEVQSSIWPTPKELMAVSDGATIILSDFNLFHVRKGDKPVVKNLMACLQDGQSARIDWPKTEFGSVEMALEYSGTIELIVNGEKHYQLPFGTVSTGLSSGTTLRQIGGWRFHDIAPSIEIRAIGPATIKIKTAEYIY